MQKQSLKETTGHEYNLRGQMGKMEFILTPEMKEMIDKIKVNDSELTDLKKTEFSGSTGVIFNGKYQGNDVIVKEIEVPADKPEMKDMLKVREIFLMCYIGAHSNIINLYGWTEEPHFIRLILENLKGGPIQGYIKPGCLSIKQKIKILWDAAEGLAHIHSKGVIHRDIKPHNIGIVSPIDGQSDLGFTTKIYDFGVARDDDTEGSKTTQSGTIKYNAPEQTNKKPYDNKVDIFAFAIMTFELFAEKKAYSSKSINDNQLKLKVKREGLRPLEWDPVNIDTPQEITDMMVRNWDKDPEKRMSSEELAKYLKDLYAKQ